MTFLHLRLIHFRSSLCFAIFRSRCVVYRFDIIRLVRCLSRIHLVCDLCYVHFATVGKIGEALPFCWISYRLLPPRLPAHAFLVAQLSGLSRAPFCLSVFYTSFYRFTPRLNVATAPASPQRSSVRAFVRLMLPRVWPSR